MDIVVGVGLCKGPNTQHVVGIGCFEKGPNTKNSMEMVANRYYAVELDNIRIEKKEQYVRDRRELGKLVKG